MDFFSKTFSVCTHSGDGASFCDFAVPFFFLGGGGGGAILNQIASMNIVLCHDVHNVKGVYILIYFNRLRHMIFF